MSIKTKYKALGYREIIEKNLISPRYSNTHKIRINNVFIKDKILVILFMYNNKLFKAEMNLNGLAEADWNYFMYRENQGVGNIVLGSYTWLASLYYLINIDMRYNLCIIADEYEVVDDKVYIHNMKRPGKDIENFMQDGDELFYTSSNIDLRKVKYFNTPEYEFKPLEGKKRAFKVEELQ